jgi:ABC-type sugar transport system substrate-binding protein
LAAASSSGSDAAVERRARRAAGAPFLPSAPGKTLRRRRAGDMISSTVENWPGARQSGARTSSGRTSMTRHALLARACAIAAVGAFAAGAAFAKPDVVSGPGHDPNCFAPWNADTKHFQWEKREGPHRIAIVNGFVGNTWRIQMIQTAKAFAEQPDIASRIEEFKAVSTGTDVAAQLGAIEDFINQGYDAIVTIAVSPEGFDRVIRLADRNDVVVVPFDNVLDTDKVMQVNEDQLEMGRMYGRWLTEQLGDQTSGKILEVRGLPGNSVDRDRHIGFREVFEPTGDWEIVEVVGNWDDGTAQKVTADAIAVHGQFDARRRAGRHHRRRARDARRGPPAGAHRRRVRERLPQAAGGIRTAGAQGHLHRPVAGHGGHRDEGRARRARRPCDAAADLGADPLREV